MTPAYHLKTLRRFIRQEHELRSRYQRGAERERGLHDTTVALESVEALELHFRTGNETYLPDIG